jgi:hypothetical protein
VVGRRRATQYGTNTTHTAGSTDCLTEKRDASDADPDGQYPRFHHQLDVPSLMRRNRRAGGGTEGDIHIMGPVHLDYPAHNSPLHELHTTHTEDTGRP